MRKLFAILLIASLFLTTGFIVRIPKVAALSGSQFKAGRIIDDGIFYAPNSMNSTEIQSFLNSKVPVCDTYGTQPYGGTTRAAYSKSKGYPPPFICLKSYKQNTGAKGSESGLCDAMAAHSNRSAAHIIDDVAKACGVSPKVLIVLLQKEQGLVTDDWPWPIQYRSATGYGCPDTAPCDSDYYGFFNQVYNAAKQFRNYRANESLFNFHAGESNFIRYSPVSSCGGSNVFIESQATAGLYNYTPYQPNSAALNNLDGTGNSCSSYGNRNFWRYYSHWFGNPTIDTRKDSVFIGDWDGDGRSTPAIRRGNDFFFDNNNDGEADVSYSWGKSTDQVIVGDWDNDGRDEIGLKRGNEYFIDTNNNAETNTYIVWGKPTDQVIVGDWNGDGRDTLGLKRGNMYFLDYDNNGHSNVSYAWGKTTDSAIVGDWDGDNTDELGLRRGNQYFLDYDNNASSNVSYAWGKDTDRLLIGDWDGNGSETLGLKRGNQYFLDYDNNASSNVSYAWGDETDKVMVGDWDNDNIDELGLKRGSNMFLDNDNNAHSDVSFIYTY